jgi:hypothetical protein
LTLAPTPSSCAVCIRRPISGVISGSAVSELPPTTTSNGSMPCSRRTIASARDHVVDAFARDHPPELQHDRTVRRKQQSSARFVAPDRGEFVRREAARDHRDPRRIDIVMATEVGGVLRAFGDHRVGIVDHPLLEQPAGCRSPYGPRA